MPEELHYLADALAALSVDLKASGVGEVYSFVPERYNPPCAAIFLGNPVVGPGQTFGSRVVGFEVAILPDTGTNETVTKNLIALIESVTLYLASVGWTVTQVGQPYMLASSGAQFLAVNLGITADVPFQ